MPLPTKTTMFAIVAACFLFCAGGVAADNSFPPGMTPDLHVYTLTNGSTFSCCPEVCYAHCFCCSLTAVKPNEATPEMIKRQEALNLTLTYASDEALTEAKPALTEAKASNEALTFTEAKPSNEALTLTEAKPSNEALATPFGCQNCPVTCCCCLFGPIEPGTVDPELVKIWAAGNMTLTQSNEAFTQSGGHRRMLIA